MNFIHKAWLRFAHDHPGRWHWFPIPPTAQGELRKDEAGAAFAKAREVDWSILMAHGQAGDQEAYRRLLEEITPYVRSLAVKSHRDPTDIEDSVQDVLLTVHAVRHTYDPTRPFGPWLVAIAQSPHHGPAAPSGPHDGPRDAAYRRA